MEDLQVKFNAGVDVAYSISNILKRCEYFARMHDFTGWFSELKILDRRLYSKVTRHKHSEKIMEEIKEAAFDKHNVLRTYQTKLNKSKSIPPTVVYQLYAYLAGYEVILRKYVDKFGYGMPDMESQEMAIMEDG